MSITAQSVIRRAVTTLADPTSVRWTLNELVRYLNDGQRDMMIHRPDLLSTTDTITCVAGTKQSIPSGGYKLLDVPRNDSAASKRAVRLARRELLDAQAPGWHSSAAKAEIAHYTFDPRDPDVFYVYPPATVAAQLVVVYAAHPTEIAQPGLSTALPVDPASDGSAPAVVIGNLSIPDIMATPLADYVLYRAYSKDATYASNLQRAMAHYQAYATALGIEVKATLMAGPNSNSPFNPLQPAIAPIAG